MSLTTWLLALGGDGNAYLGLWIVLGFVVFFSLVFWLSSNEVFYFDNIKNNAIKMDF